MPGICVVLFSGVFFPDTACAFDLRKIDPRQAAERLNRFSILDARPQKEWQKAHLPGARSFSWENYTRTDSDGVKYRIFKPEELGNALGALGISHTDAVLVYGDADSSWGGEGWLVWMLAWLGHQGAVYFLDGGIHLWRDSGQPVTSDIGNSHGQVTYQIHPRPEMNRTRDDIASQRGQINLIDTRGYLTEYLPGHLPGAIHIPWGKFFKGPYRQSLAPHELSALLEEKGVDLRKPVVYYCTGGIRSGFSWLVHSLGTLPPAVNFEGGTEEWARKHPLVR
ncbi:MAG: rhodanese-like domain-containing protein [Desulfobacterales bacterium]|nr:rhodanese-like domain-containing protein [Desulfobacterales bacterium]